MARVFDTANGPMLTSLINAHSARRGDMVMIGTEEVGYCLLTVADNRTTQDRQQWIEFEGTPETLGERFGLPFPTNHRMNRVVGANCSGLLS